MSADAPILALVGTTATGKTDVAERIADALDAEIVCADSRQVFADLETGTGKPEPSVRAARPHHLFESLALDERASAGWFARAAAAVIGEIRARGRVPFLVGGAGLYLRALREGLAPEPPMDAVARARLRDDHRERTTAELRERLERLDPESAARLRPADRQRTSRALEVVELSGHPLGWWHRQPVRRAVEGRWRIVELRVPAAALADRIRARTRAMFAGGLVEETRGLVARGLEPALRRLRAVGYDEALELLEGVRSRESAEERTDERTRQLAKRQRTWFRHQLPADVVDGLAEPETIDRRVARILRGEGPEIGPGSG